MFFYKKIRFFDNFCKSIKFGILVVYKLIGNAIGMKHLIAQEFIPVPENKSFILSAVSTIHLV